MNNEGNQTHATQRDDTPDIIRWRYRQKEKVNSYEQNRYGNINKSLSHFLDCDAINTFIQKYFKKRGVLALDLACGTGRLSRTLAGAYNYSNIVSMDFSDTMLLQAKEKAQAQQITLRPVRSDGFNLAFGDKKFDVVFTIRFLRHFRDHDRPKLYQEINRVLKPGGILVFDVINSDVDTAVTKRKVWDEPYTKERITKELAEYGFELTDMIAGNIVKDKLFVFLKKMSLIKLGLWYSRKIRGKTTHVDVATSWMVCARKKRDGR